MVVGELSLNGEVRSVSGVLPRVIRARELGCRYCIIPFENLAEGALVKDMKVVGVQNIKEVLKLVSDPDAFGKENQFSEVNSEENQIEESLMDFGEICGQESARRAAEISQHPVYRPSGHWEDHACQKNTYDHALSYF